VEGAHSIWRYASHEEVHARSDKGQDDLWKFNIPASEQGKVSKMLGLKGITRDFLFGDEVKPSSEMDDKYRKVALNHRPCPNK
jgi:hypothetical protein